VDFAVPARFNLTYVDRDGQEKTPLCIHRAPLGTHERFIGFLIEHFAGAFPPWLAPVQAVLIPIADRHVEYCQRVARQLRAEGMRVLVDDGPERMQNKIRKAQLSKIPYMLVVGDKEVQSEAVSVRLRSSEDLKSQPVGEFAARVKALVARYALALWE
jgi:threonyl-tRNA synthetase